MFAPLTNLGMEGLWHPGFMTSCLLHHVQSWWTVSVLQRTDKFLSRLYIFLHKETVLMLRKLFITFSGTNPKSMMETKHWSSNLNWSLTWIHRVWGRCWVWWERCDMWRDLGPTAAAGLGQSYTGSKTGAESPGENVSRDWDTCREIEICVVRLRYE